MPLAKSVGFISALVWALIRTILGVIYGFFFLFIWISVIVNVYFYMICEIRAGEQACRQILTMSDVHILQKYAYFIGIQQPGERSDNMWYLILGGAMAIAGLVLLLVCKRRMTPVDFYGAAWRLRVHNLTDRSSTSMQWCELQRLQPGELRKWVTITHDSFSLNDMRSFSSFKGWMEQNLPPHEHSRLLPQIMERLSRPPDPPQVA